jgi:phosphoenolpyruvate-protein kinase (PTS system EI component)
MFQEPAFSGFFRAQVQAIGELSHGNEIAVIVPFATNTNDIALVRNSLSEFGARPIPVGVMLETPALAFSIPELATAADFVVIDTNDLMQCFFGADRSLNAMAQYLEPYSLSFFRFLQGLAKSLAEFRIPNQICGQLALQPHMAAVLVGLGFNNFTIEPSAIPALRSLIEASDTQKLQAAVHELMRSDPSELRSKMEQLFQPQTS